jgi:hypothetical protein
MREAGNTKLGHYPNVRIINPSKKRYKDNAVTLLKKSVRCIEAIDYKVAGYFLMTWDDKGSTAASMHTGGPISIDLLPIHAYTHASRFLDDDK